MLRNVASLEVVRPNGHEMLLEVDAGLGLHIDERRLKGVSPITALCLAVFLENPDIVFPRQFFEQQVDEYLNDPQINEIIRGKATIPLDVSTKSSGIRELNTKRPLKAKPHLFVLGSKDKEFLFLSDMTDKEAGLHIVTDHAGSNKHRQRYVSDFTRKFQREQNRSEEKRSKKESKKKTTAVYREEPVEEVGELHIPDEAVASAEKREATREDIRKLYELLVGYSDQVGTTISHQSLRDWMTSENLYGIMISDVVRLAERQGFIRETKDETGQVVYIRLAST